MRIIVQRLFRAGRATIGLWTFAGDAEPCAFTLEDAVDVSERAKVAGATRIPAGVYAVTLRTVGGWHERYSRRFMWHRGMLWLQNVPEFEYVLVHPGNTERDTAGCILVADSASYGGELIQSIPAYQRVYTRALAALERRESLTLEVRNEWDFTG